jgi:hypothetical protein
MEIWQIHHEFKDGTTEMCAQRELESEDDMRQFFEDVKVSHPLPEGAKGWLIVPEDSPQFWVTEKT